MNIERTWWFRVGVPILTLASASDFFTTQVVGLLVRARLQVCWSFSSVSSGCSACTKGYLASRPLFLFVNRRMPTRSDEEVERPVVISWLPRQGV
jgi:hypothetical protein